MSYKQRKVVEIMAEITAIKGQTSYDVSGVKPEIVRVCYRLPTENFKDLTSGDYTWTTTGSGYSLQINNEVVRNTAEAYQVYYVHDIQSSKYTTDFEVDINTLVTRYNEAVDDIHRLWLFTQKLAFVSDDTTIPIILPQLGEDEIWMRKGDGYVGVTLTDAEGMILDMINKYVTDKKQEISDHVTAELVKVDKHILDETLKRIQEITEHTNVMKQEITDLTTAQKKILLDYVNLTLKPMLLAYVNDELKPMLLTYVNTVLKPDLESYTTAKKGELNTATQGHLQTLINKTNELLALLIAKESELETALSNFTETLKTALNNHTNEKKSEITIHANSESQRVQAEVVAKGEEVKDEINQLTPDNIGVRVEALEGNRVLRSGDVMTGTLNINMEGKDKVVLKSKGTIDGVIGSDTDGVIVENSKSGESIRLNNDGVGIYPSTSLKTEAKDLSEAVNELLDNKLDKGDVSEDYNTGKKIVNKINGLAGGYNGKFPLTVASKNGIYLLPATNKFYVCVENYSGSSLTAPNANFEELSVFQNRNKLENLNKIKLIFNNKQTTNTGIFTLDDSIENYKFINIIYAFGGDPTNLVAVGSATFCTDFLKSHYNAGLTFATTSIAENGSDVTFEQLYVKFINGTQINIEENRGTNNATLSNNKIYQIYAWN